MRSHRNILLATTLSIASLTAVGASGESVAAKWKPQEIRYSYTGFTTAYDCDAVENKLEAILKAVGAHPNTKVSASGCAVSKPSKDFFITITTAMPSAASEAGDASQATAKILQRLDVKDGSLDQTFQAQWREVDLSRDRKLDLRPGDCELMEGLRDQVFPKLGVKIVEERITCTPHQLSIQTPTLKVGALARTG